LSIQVLLASGGNTERGGWSSDVSAGGFGDVLDPKAVAIKIATAANSAAAEA
jgi:hypothetical protein